jgi:RNA polymerase sigma factor (sigma-70 family)
MALRCEPTGSASGTHGRGAAEPETAGADERAPGLIELIRRGDAHAIETMYRQQVDSALALARRLVDWVTAEDVVADAFERTLAAIRRNSGPTQDSGLRAYLSTVVRNCAADWYRRRREIPVADPALDAGSTPEVSGSVIESIAVNDVLAVLPARWRDVLWLTHVDDLSRAELASRLDLAPGAAAQLSVRARAGFRREYAQQNRG